MFVVIIGRLIIGNVLYKELHQLKRLIFFFFFAIMYKSENSVPDVISDSF